MNASRYLNAFQWMYDAARLIDASAEPGAAYRQKSGHQDIVSLYDAKIEAFISEQILRLFPDDGIVGEELHHQPNGRWIWYIDPIDGTSNFVNQRKNYAISVACYRDGLPGFGLVYDVAADRLFHAQNGNGAYCNHLPLETRNHCHTIHETLLYTPWLQPLLLKQHAHLQGVLRLAKDVRGVRSLGSVALELCALAAGEAELFIAAASSPWDHNAARIILEETGGTLVTMAGKPVPIDTPTTIVAASNHALLDCVMRQYFEV